MFAALLIVSRAVHIAAAILIAGIFTFDVVAIGLTNPPASEHLLDVERLFLRLALSSLIAAFLSALLWFWLEVVNMSGLSFAQAFSATASVTVLSETRFGHVWALRFGITVVAFVFATLAVVRNGERRRSIILVLWLLSVVLLVSLACVSHAAAAPVQPLGVLGDALHLCAAGGWIGGLVPLAIFLAHTRASLSPDERIATLERFSTFSLCCVGALVASGICNSLLLVGSIHALFTTTYGRLLLLKLALFAVLLGFGGRNRLAIKSRRLGAATGSDSLPQLRRNVVYEICVGAAVIAIVACLGVTPPARHP